MQRPADPAFVASLASYSRPMPCRLGRGYDRRNEPEIAKALATWFRPHHAA
jgi:hypothetical protein